MGRPLRVEFPGAFYHVTSRGNEQKDVFKSQRDRERFLEYLESATERYGAVVHCYCLMSNHYHLLMETPGGNLSQIMRHINGAYTNYFNVKRKRSGHLFQGRYKAILVEADAYAAELSRYIHLNPMRVGIVSKPEDYRWSSYRSYIGQSQPPNWLRTEFIFGYFGKQVKGVKEKYQRFVNDLLDREYESPISRSAVSSILGSVEFIAEIEGQHLRERAPDRNLPELRKLSRRFSLEEIIQVGRSEIVEERTANKAIIYLCHKYSGARLRVIGELFGIGESAVSQISKRFERKIHEDAELKKMIQGLKERLRVVKV